MRTTGAASAPVGPMATTHAGSSWFESWRPKMVSPTVYLRVVASVALVPALSLDVGPRLWWPGRAARPR